MYVGGTVPSGACSMFLFNNIEKYDLSSLLSFFFLGNFFKLVKIQRIK